MRRGSLSLHALALVVALGCAARAQTIEIVSGLGAETDRQALAAITGAREIYSRLGMTLRRPELPTRVILVPTVFELAPSIGPSSGRSGAFSFSGSDHNSIIIAWTAPGNALRAAAHEYAHLVDPLAGAPPWFREGLAEYLSYLEPNALGELRPMSPSRHVVRLSNSPWMPLASLTAAARNSTDFHRPTFYAQSWLVVHWLASEGRPLRDLRPEELQSAIDLRGVESVEAALRRHFEAIAGSPTLSETQTEAMPAKQSPMTWEVRLALADVDRELGRVDQAEAAFAALAAERPADPALEAARGALAMDSGRYAEAEQRLSRAAASPDAPARTRYRLALMLLRPEGGSIPERARRAAEQSRLALEMAPSAQPYRLALAHALMVDQQWAASASELNRLAADPAWRDRAGEEMEELDRRRQQAVSAVPKPSMARAPEAGPIPVAPLELADVPAPPKPPPPAPLSWPPPGASILAGRIDFVDCRGPEKVIVMRHPVLSLRIREPKGKPAKLFHSPEKAWTEIPCGAKGWTVNVAYYPRPGLRGLLGDAVAILF